MDANTKELIKSKYINSVSNTLSNKKVNDQLEWLVRFLPDEALIIIGKDMGLIKDVEEIVEDLEYLDKSELSSVIRTANHLINK